MPTWAKILIAVLILVAPVGAGIISARRSDAPVNSNTIKYLALGDSYTIGQSVGERDRWPNQLVERFKADGKDLKIVANPSVTGYTTQNLIDSELPLLPQLKPDFVSILIGVNDYVQGVNADVFETHLDYIITTVQSALQDPGNMVLITIPDYGLTPTGAQFGDPKASEAAIEQFNQIIVAAGKAHNVPVADVFPASQGVKTDPSLTASDGLHPSGKQYKLWTNQIYRTLKEAGLPKKRAAK